MILESPRSLAEVCRTRAQQHPDQTAYTFLLDGETQKQTLTYGEFDLRTRAIAAQLQALNTDGDRALLLYEPGLDFAVGFFACLYAGVLPVPAYPPDPMRLERSMPRLRAIVDDAQASIVLGDTMSLRWGDVLLDGLSTIQHVINTSEVTEGDAEQWRPVRRGPTDLAFLQYTSGSTGQPKGVMISNRAILYQTEQMMRWDVDNAVGVHWLPTYHDLGLVAGVLLPMYASVPTISMSPFSFVQRPLRWLEAISRYGGTTTGGPNFAFDLCVRKIKDEECENLDLSCWKHALNGGEPIRAETLRAFTEKFRPFGLRDNLFRPSYGMAETTLGVSGNLSSLPRVKHVLASELEIQHRAVEAPPSAATRELVACGHPLPDTTLEIVDPQTCVARLPGEVGEIWVQSPSVAEGYWNRPEETKRVFGATIERPAIVNRVPPNGTPRAGLETPDERFLRTGDLGFLHDGQLYITGRIKDLIIIGGRNHYPQDMERTVVEAHESLKVDGGAAFSVDVDGGEQLVVVQEVQRPNRYDLNAIIDDVREQILERHEISPHAIVLIKAGKIPKTTSGKIQRRQCRQDYLEGRLSVIAQWSSQADAVDAGRAVRYVAPRNALEKQLAAIWCDVLGLDRVGAKDNFFDLGGQSIQATLMASRIRSQFQVEVPLGRVFADPTIANLSNVIADLRSPAQGDEGHDRIGSDLTSWQGEASGERVLSVSQEQLWVIEQLSEGTTSHSVYAVAQIDGALDPDRLTGAVDSLLERHEVMRTAYPSIDGSPGPLLMDGEAPIQWLEIDVNDDQDRNVRLERAVAIAKQRRFDLATERLFHLTAIRINTSSPTEDRNADLQQPDQSDQWVIVMVVHHLVADGWSLGIIAQELSALYKGETLPSLPVQFEHYARWQRRQIADGVWNHHLDYWVNHFEGFQPQEIATDFPRTSHTRFESCQASFEIPKALASRFHARCSELGATPFMGLMTVAQAVVSRYAGSTDVCLGTPVAGRTRQEAEGLVGMFVNTLAIRNRWSVDTSFQELLRQVKQTTVDALSHQDAPLATVVDRIAPQRSTANPLFQVLFVLQNLPQAAALDAHFTDEIDGVSLTAQPLDVGSTGSGLDLTVELRRNAEGYVGNIEYNGSLFSPETVEQFAEHYLKLLEALVHDPQQAVCLASLDDGASSSTSVVRGERREQFVDSPTFIGMFERAAITAPHSSAIRAGDLTITYQQLNDQASRLASDLANRGVTSGSVVGVCLPRSVDLVATLLGIQKCGAVYLPLDPNYPTSRLQFMCEDAGAGWVVADRRENCEWLTDDRNIQLIELTQRRRDHERGDGRCVVSPGNVPNELAYIIYTSGSSGTPKGVLIEQGGWRNSLLGLADILNITAGSRVVQSSSPNFDGAMAEMGVALATGATLVLPLTHEDLCTVMQRERVSHCFLPPTAWTAMDPDRFPHLDVAISVGEACPQSVARRWSADRRFFNGYGPTECTISATLAECKGEGTPPIGRPLPNTSAWVLDENRQLVPRGVAGELFLSGAGVGRGYLGRPNLTCDRFLNDLPLVNEGACPSDRCYRTGDRVKVRHDGQLEFVGRVDHQVKLRGFRIELGEVEEAAQQHPLVQQAVSRIHTDGDDTPDTSSGHRQLILYVAAGDQCDELTEDAIRTHLTSLLPSHCLPQQVVVMSKLPLTSVGKIDRDQLTVQPSHSAMVVSPRTERESQLAGIWREVLRIDQVGIHDNFFELGGDSILAIQVTSQAQRAGIAITPRQMFQFQTVAELSAVADIANTIEAEQGDLSGALDALPIHQWFMDQPLADPNAFQQAVCLELHERLEASELRVALAEVLRQHDALRLQLSLADQTLSYAGVMEEPILLRRDFRNIDPRELDDARHAFQTEVHDCIDLTLGRAFAAGMCDMPDGQELILSAHHLAVDGVSWRIVLEDLLLAIEQSRSYGSVSWPAKTTSVRQWSARLDRWRQSPEVQQEHGYWQDVVSQMKPLPRDGKGENLAMTAEVLHSSLAAEITKQLPHANRACRTQTTDLLLAALWKTHQQWTGRDDFSLHLESHGREPLFDDLDLSRTVGWFTSVYPVALDHQGDGPQSFTDDLMAKLRAAKRNRQQRPNGGLGYGLLRWREDDGNDSLGASMELVVNFLGDLNLGLSADAPAKMDRRGAFLHNGAENARPAIIELNVYLLDKQLHFEWHYSRQLHDDATIEQLDRNLRHALATVVQHGAQQPLFTAAPEDFPWVRLDQSDIDRLVDSDACVEDILPVSPLQAGMIFRGNQGTADPNIQQATCDLQGKLAVDAFESAWNAVVQRHESLRCSFHWHDLPEPVQMIHEQASVPFQWVDGDTLDVKQIESLLQRELESGFAWDAPPLMRVMVIRLGERHWRVVWTHHHILADGWSMPLILKEVLLCYECDLRDQPLDLPTPPSLQSVVKWHRLQEWEESAVYWKEELNGCVAPSRLSRRVSQSRLRTNLSTHGRSVDQEVELPTDVATQLSQFCRDQRLSLNTTLQVAWALTVAQHLQCRDVVFGATVSGRTMPIDNIDSLVGMLINVLPTRVTLNADQTLGELLSETQRRQAARTELEQTPPNVIQRCCDRRLDGALFDHLFVVENYPLAQNSSGASLEVDKVRFRQQTSLPLTVLVIPGRKLVVRMIFDTEHFESSEIEALLNAFVGRLSNIAAASDASLSDEMPWLATASQQAPSHSDIQRNTDIAPPTNDLEALLLEIWQETLEVPDIGIDDDLSQLGGFSLQALAIVAKAQDAQLPIQPQHLFLYPTIRRLAAAIDSLEHDSTQSMLTALAPLKTDGDGPPLFLVHPAGGNAFPYIELATQTQWSGPIIGIQAHGLVTGEAPDTTVEAMAERYASMISEAHPTGPIRLGGWSLGGLVAYEVAVRLSQQGRDVGTVALLDIGPDPEVLADAEAFSELQQWLPSADAITLEQWEALPRGEQVERFAGKIREAGLMADAAADEIARRMLDVLEASRRAAKSYQPPASSLDVLLIQAADTPVDLADQWQRVVSGQVTRQIIEGNHLSLMQGHSLSAVAECLSLHGSQSRSD